MKPRPKVVGHQGVLELLGRQTGMTFTASRLADAEAAIARGMARAGFDDAGQYRELLEMEGAEFEELVAELTVTETYFLREPAQFDYLRQTVLSELKRRIVDRPLRIWSAGCATGEEAYSLALVLSELGLAADNQILATDISQKALAKGRAGVYRDWSLRGPAATVARQWLRRDGERYLVPDELRRQVHFAYLNLVSDAYPCLTNGTWGIDLILCRNVLIYFEPPIVQQVVRRLFECLTAGGWLVTSASDPPLNALAPFEEIATDSGIFYRRPLENSAALEVIDSIPAQNATESPPVLAAPRQSSLADLQSLAHTDPSAAYEQCLAALSGEPLSAELHYLRAMLLLALDRPEEAAAAARQAIYLNRSLAMGHFLLGAILQRQHDPAGARRAYRNVAELCLSRPADEIVPLSENESAGSLAAAAAAHQAMLESAKDGAV